MGRRWIRPSASDCPRSAILADDRLGIHRLNYEDKTRGAYATQTGQVVARWDSLWTRPELWLSICSTIC